MYTPFKVKGSGKDFFGPRPSSLELRTNSNTLVVWWWVGGRARRQRRCSEARGRGEGAERTRERSDFTLDRSPQNRRRKQPKAGFVYSKGWAVTSASDSFRLTVSERGCRSAPSLRSPLPSPVSFLYVPPPPLGDEVWFEVPLPYLYRLTAIAAGQILSADRWIYRAV